MDWFDIDHNGIVDGIDFFILNEKLGKGQIGMEAMKRIALHPALSGRPFILETPNDDEGYIEEIHTVLSWLE